MYMTFVLGGPPFFAISFLESIPVNFSLNAMQSQTILKRHCSVKLIVFTL